jgi:hypothetical protein
MEVIIMYEVDQYTVSLLHFEDGLKDECGKVWAAYNGASTSTILSRIGSSSIYFNNNTQYISTPANADFNFGSNDFTIEFWFYLTSLSNQPILLDMRTTSTDNFPTLTLTPDNKLTYWRADVGYSCVGATTIQVNTWYHVAWVKTSSGSKMYLNGVLDAQRSSNDVFGVNSPIMLGGSTVATSRGIIGYIDEFRISNIARWISNFNPGVPTNLTATAGESQVTLSWTAVDGAMDYNVKRSTTAGGPYTTIATNVTYTTFVDTTVTNGITYYYVVTAVNSSGIESANSNEASAIPIAFNNSLLRVTMLDSSEREYQLSTAEIDGFINWFNRHVSTDTTSYMLNKIEVLQNSKEYLAFDKIISFEVIPLK